MTDDCQLRHFITIRTIVCSPSSSSTPSSSNNNNNNTSISSCYVFQTNLYGALMVIITIGYNLYDTYLVTYLTLPIRVLHAYEVRPPPQQSVLGRRAGIF